MSRLATTVGIGRIEWRVNGVPVASWAQRVKLDRADRQAAKVGRPAVLSAAAADQLALEGYQGHRIFTYALLDALVKGDTNTNGRSS